MKIIFFNYLPLEYGGGLAKYFCETAVELTKRYPSLTLSIITFDDAFARKIQFLYSLYFLKSPIRKNEKKKAITTALGNVSYKKVKNFHELRTLLTSADRIYSKNDVVEVSILKFFLGYRSLPPVILGCHTPLFYENTPSLQARLHNLLYTSFLYRFLIKDAAKYHVLNSFDEKLLKKHFPKNKVIKIYNPFSFPTRPNTQNTTKDRKAMTILWAGRLTEQKGIDDLIHLVENVNEQSYSSRIIWQIAGDGEYRSDIIALSKKWQNVQYLGYVPSEKMVKVYLGSDIFISTSKWESLPYTLLEALSFSLSIIAYDIHGNDEIVTKKNGFLVSTIEEFADTILALTKKRTLSRNTVEKKVVKKFATETIYPKLYTELFTTV